MKKIFSSYFDDNSCTIWFMTMLFSQTFNAFVFCLMSFDVAFPTGNIFTERNFLLVKLRDYEEKKSSVESIDLSCGVSIILVKQTLGLSTLFVLINKELALGIFMKKFVENLCQFVWIHLERQKTLACGTDYEL